MSQEFLKNLNTCMYCREAQIETDCIKCLADKESYPSTCPLKKW